MRRFPWPERREVPGQPGATRWPVFLAAVLCRVSGAAAADHLEQRGWSAAGPLSISDEPLQVAHQDCYSPYDGQHLLRVRACSQKVADALNEALEREFHRRACVDLSIQRLTVLPKAGKCAEETTICSAAVSAQWRADFGDETVRILSVDAGAQLRRKGGVPKALHPELITEEDESEEEKDPDAFYKRWRTSAEKRDRVHALVNASEGVARIEEIGRSHQNRSIEAVRLTGESYVPGKPKVYFNFNIHAREWIAGMAGVYAVERMIQRAKANPDWYKNTEIVLVPLSNPDGFEYSQTTDRYWRKNRREPLDDNPDACWGVDLNRNFPLDFGGHSTSSDQCTEVFPGPKPLSEPEARVLASIVDEAPLDIHIDVHSFSALILCSWSYTKKTKYPRQVEQRDLGGKIHTAMFKKHGYNYETCGDLYLASGVFQDYSADHGALGFTIELRPACHGDDLCGVHSFNPPEHEILPTAEELLEGLYAAIEWAQYPKKKVTRFMSFSIFFLVILVLGVVFLSSLEKKVACLPSGGARELAGPTEQSAH